MFEDQFFWQYVLALCVGVAFCFPFGPMGLLATHMWLHGHKRVALTIVGGICIGDLLLGGIVLTSLKLATVMSTPKWPLAVLLVAVAYMSWVDAGRGRSGMPVRNPWRYGVVAFGATVGQLSNWLMFWGVYGLGTGYLTDKLGDWMPAVLANIAPVRELGDGAIVMVLACLLTGMVAGWSVYGVCLSLMAKGYGKVFPRRHKHHQRHPPRNFGMWVGRGSSIIMLGCAILIMVDSVEPLV